MVITAETSHGVSELRTDKGVHILESGLIVKSPLSPDERVQAYRLRHRIFAEELNWVCRTDSGEERDAYDANAIFFGVLDKDGSLRAFLRLLMPSGNFMLEREFIALSGGEHQVRKAPDTAEISRLCVAHEARGDTLQGNFGVYHISLLLLKGVYHWCLQNRIRYLYAVAEPRVYRMYRAKGFPFAPIAPAIEMPDGTIAVALLLDWRAFEQNCEKRQSGIFKWFNKDRSDLHGWRFLQPEFA